MICNSCKVDKPCDEFTNDKSRKTGKCSWCRPCKYRLNKAWLDRHPDYRLAYCHNYIRKGGERVRLMVRGYQDKRKDKARQIIRERYGKACVCCGEANSEFLTLDHINGGGNKHRKEIGSGGVQMYLWLIRHGLPDGYRTLCFNCNASLGTHGYCPHGKLEKAVA